MTSPDVFESRVQALVDVAIEFQLLGDCHAVADGVAYRLWVAEQTGFPGDKERLIELEIKMHHRFQCMDVCSCAVRLWEAWEASRFVGLDRDSQELDRR